MNTTIGNAHDICWIYALSFLKHPFVQDTIYRNTIPKIAKQHTGVTGNCSLNNSGDRESISYIILEITDE
jgi:hypothetical protein